MSVNDFPTKSRMTLKKHSTSLVVDARGCSGGKPASLLSFLSHSALSMFVRKAMVVFLVNPCMLFIGLNNKNNLGHHT